MKTQTPKYTIEVVPYELACWAPKIEGQQFDWAWCVITPTGNSERGAIKGTKKRAREIAEAVAKRMHRLTYDQNVKYAFNISETGRQLHATRHSHTARV